MEKIKTKVLNLEFGRFWKRFVILSLVVVLLGGVSVLACFRTQISQGAAYVQQLRREEKDRTERPLPSEETQKDAASHDGEREKWEREQLFENAPITEPTLGAKLLACGYVFLCCLIFAVYWLAFAAWMYQAGTKAHLHGFLWLLLGLGGNVFAGILLLLVRCLIRKKCPACGEWLSNKARYCAHCGQDLYVRCPACGRECGSGEQFCSVCGHSLQNEAGN